MELQPWSRRAINLPEHANNPIHTDAGARAAGFRAAIVAGVTVYSYLTHPPARAWGTDWLRRGGGELRLRKPVFDNDLVQVAIAESEQSECDASVTATVDDQLCASFAVWQAVEAPPMRPGEPLESDEFELDQHLASYGVRSGDDLALYAEQNIAHPGLWPNLANTVYTRQLISGPWIHTRSRIYHQGIVRAGDMIRIEATVIDRFTTRAGERAVTDMAFFANDQPVARVEHEALVALSKH